MLAPSLADAERAAAKLRAIPQVSRVVTLSSLVPDRQQEKLALVKKLANKLNPALNPTDAQPPPTDAENIEALNDEAGRLTEIAEGQNGPGAVAARRLSADLAKLASADQETRARASAVFIAPLKIALHLLSNLLQAQPVSVNTLPPDLVREWQMPDGRNRVEVMPKGNVDNDKALEDFTRAVLAVEPSATGGPVAILESGAYGRFCIHPGGLLGAAVDRRPCCGSLWVASATSC